MGGRGWCVSGGRVGCSGRRTSRARSVVGTRLRQGTVAGVGVGVLVVLVVLCVVGVLCVVVVGCEWVCVVV